MSLQMTLSASMTSAYELFERGNASQDAQLGHATYRTTGTWFPQKRRRTCNLIGLGFFISSAERMNDGRIRELEDTVALLSSRLKVLEEESASLCAQVLQLKTVEHSYRSMLAGLNVEGCKTSTTTDPVPEQAQHHALKPKEAAVNKKKGKDISNQQKRFVALKIMYLGNRYHGFASQGCTLKTVESEFFAALEKTKLVIGPISDAKYSRCGRTDKGVSATAQVVALYLRSIRKGTYPPDNSEIDSASQNHAHELECDRVTSARESRESEEHYAALGADETEIDYVSVLNRALPSDIRVLGWCPVPPGFHARFSCLYREYKYFFIDDGLNIDVMKQASQKLLGEHDFRNFCKMDAENIHNYRRNILRFDIVPTNERWAGRQLWVMHVRGNAFLWHQVRCMAAVIFMVGYGHEHPSIIDDLLDVDKVVRKPQYLMASELPLVLQTCAFQGLNFRCRPEAAKLIHRHLLKHLHEALVCAALISEGMLQLDCPDQSPQSKTMHVPLMSRPTEPTYSERRKKSGDLDV